MAPIPFTLPPPSAVCARDTYTHTHAHTRAHSKAQAKLPILQQACFWSWELSACWEGGGEEEVGLYSD